MFVNIWDVKVRYCTLVYNKGENGFISESIVKSDFFNLFLQIKIWMTKSASVYGDMVRIIFSWTSYTSPFPIHTDVSIVFLKMFSSHISTWISTILVSEPDLQCFECLYTCLNWKCKNIMLEWLFGMHNSIKGAYTCEVKKPIIREKFRSTILLRILFFNQTLEVHIQVKPHTE